MHVFDAGMSRPCFRSLAVGAPMTQNVQFVEVLIEGWPHVFGACACCVPFPFDICRTHSHASTSSLVPDFVPCFLSLAIRRY
jgi:hypothetical protein